MNETGRQRSTQQGQVPFFPEEQAPHLKDYIYKILARRWLVVTVIFACVSGTAVYDFIRAPVYRSQCRLELQPSTMDADEAKAAYDPTLRELGTTAIFNAFLETQCELMLSDRVIERTDDRFDSPGLSKGLFKVEPLEGTFLVDISFHWTDQTQTAEILNFLIKTYLDEYRNRTQTVDRETLSIKRGRAEELAPQVTRKFEALQAFKDETGLLFVENESQKDWSESSPRYDSMVLTHSEAVLKLEEVRNRYENIEAAIAEDRLEDVPEIFESGTINRLKIDLIQAQLELTSVKKEFGSLHPEVASAQANVDYIAKWISLEKKAFVAKARRDYELARNRVDKLGLFIEEEERRLEEDKKNFTEIAQKSGEYNRLLKDYTDVEGRYSGLLRDIAELELALATGGDKEHNIHIVSEAKVPSRPVKPQKSRDIALAGIMGLILGIGLCLLIDYLDTTIKSSDDVERELELPTLGYVPPIAPAGSNGAMATELLVLEKPRSVLAESFRSIRTSLMFSKAGRGLKSILVTSALPLEGKTTVSVNIAITLAQAGKKVVLIDADMRRPRLHKVFDLGDSEPGFSNILADRGESSLEAALRHVGVENLRFLPAGPHPPNPAELLGSDRMRELTASMSERFDHVIFDTPPTLSATDAAIVAQEVDGVILVVRSFKTDRDLAARAHRILIDAQARLLGAVLNNADVPRSGYYEYDGRYYDRYYRYYHHDESWYSDKKARVVRKRMRRKMRDEEEKA